MGRESAASAGSPDGCRHTLLAATTESLGARGRDPWSVRFIAYSPYHNLKKGTKYPATLITTADTDDRVVPGHSFKFAARIQYCQAGPAPVLIRIETRAGHGAGKPTAKLIEETADELAFLVKNLKMKLPEPAE